MAKKNSVADGGSGGTAAVSSVFRVGTFNSKNFFKNKSLSSKIAFRWPENV